MLIDEQITYVSKRACGIKFNIYFLHPNQPKNSSANYSTDIDVFYKTRLTYWPSWHLSMPFQFLPANRIATRLFIPTVKQIESWPMYPICQYKFHLCLQCHIQHNCPYSSDSFCYISSICICPLNKYDPHCYLKHSICSAKNNPYIREETTAFVLHYITAYKSAQHPRTTMFKKIKYNENALALFDTYPFHILTTELFNQSCYLLAVREKFIESEYIQTELVAQQRCYFIDELLNETVRSYPRLHRIKYYPLLYRQHRELKCFYDENYMCLCDMDRFSNCFAFDHSITYDCQGYNDCENGGQCFQDNTTCPSLSICVCPDCYYGTKCLFSISGFILSLDYILGYHVKPNVSFFQQPLIVKMTVVFTTLMFTVGLTNALLTFCVEKARDVDRGFY
ncbi:unnamed protein product [Rotaria socialis]|uniref:EGF-like domain-containing protein n=1 Tax=Rotaria socialis TaxID=392032 RepID=A0A817R6S5_9BILA|nr:unnamed protein product [Rotaria socialis]CAF3474421.1 unnamed protein product [Rotaria socialis]CAF4344225.1 unnamed protein product [Rotaria socialis]CAF4460142.1 unnamed protein product [Rotaria socialis]